MKKFFGFLFLTLPIFCQTSAPPGGVFGNVQFNNGGILTAAAGINVSALPSASASTNQIFLVKDGTSATDCSTGGSNLQVLCTSNGSTWIALSGGSGSGGTPAGPSGSIQFNNGGSFSSGIGTTVGSLPSASSNPNRIFLVNNGANSTDCTIGGGSTQVLCVSNGTIWTPLDNTNASNITSGTLAAARIPTLNQNTTGTSGNLTGITADSDFTQDNGSGGVQSSGKAVPAGVVVGTTDIQTLTNKSINGSEINSGTVSASNGGTGEAGTFTGIRKANGSSADTQAVAADIPLPATVVTSATSLTSTQIVTGAGGQAAQTPSSKATVDSSGNLTANSIAAGSSPPVGNGPGSLTLGESSGQTCTLGADVLSADSVNHRFQECANNNSYLPLATTPASTTNNDVATMNGAVGGPLSDSGVLIGNIPTQASNGTSGGVPCYTGANKALVSSSALTYGAIVIGGGAGTCPTVESAITNAQLPNPMIPPGLFTYQMAAPYIAGITDITSNSTSGTGGNGTNTYFFNNAAESAAGATSTTIDGTHKGMQLSFNFDVSVAVSNTGTFQIKSCPAASWTAGNLGTTTDPCAAPVVVWSTGATSFNQGGTGANNLSFEMWADQITAGTVRVYQIARATGAVTVSVSPIKAAALSTTGQYFLYAAMTWASSVAGSGAATCMGTATTGTACIAADVFKWGNFLN